MAEVERLKRLLIIILIVAIAGLASAAIAPSGQGLWKDVAGYSLIWGSLLVSFAISTLGRPWRIQKPRTYVYAGAGVLFTAVGAIVSDYSPRVGRVDTLPLFYYLFAIGFIVGLIGNRKSID